MRIKQYRRWLAIGLIMVVALGLASKGYRSAGQTTWLQFYVYHYSGDSLYEIAWIWFLGWLRPQWQAWRIAIAVFGVTACIEVSQLLPVPVAWQAHILWKLLLGTHFDRWDFLHYAIGCLIGGVSLAWWQRRMVARLQ